MSNITRHELELRLQRLRSEIRRLLAEGEKRVTKQAVYRATGVAAEETSQAIVRLREQGQYTHEQGEASDTWIVEHNLNRFPSVTVADSTGQKVTGAVRYLDANRVEITFRGAFSGKAYLN